MSLECHHRALAGYGSMVDWLRQWHSAQWVRASVVLLGAVMLLVDP